MVAWRLPRRLMLSAHTDIMSTLACAILHTLQSLSSLSPGCQLTCSCHKLVGAAPTLHAHRAVFDTVYPAYIVSLILAPQLELQQDIVVVLSDAPTIPLISLCASTGVLAAQMWVGPCTKKVLVQSGCCSTHPLLLLAGECVPALLLDRPEYALISVTAVRR